jgi:hypothetical protein
VLSRKPRGDFVATSVACDPTAAFLQQLAAMTHRSGFNAWNGKDVLVTSYGRMPVGTGAANNW